MSKANRLRQIVDSTMSGLLKLTAGVPSNATSGVDYAPGTSTLATGLLKSTTATGALTIAAANSDYVAPVGDDSQLTRKMFIDCGLTTVDKGNSSTTTQDLAYTAGSAQKITATGNFTITTSAWPPSGNLGQILLKLVNGGAYTITWPTVNWIKPDGSVTTTLSTYLAANTGRTAFQTSGTDFVLLWSEDAGTTIYGKLS